MPSYSQQIQKRLDSSVYRPSKSQLSELLKGPESFFKAEGEVQGEQIEFAALEDAGELERLVYWTDLKGLPLALVDALVELMHHRSWSTIFSFEERELESFLRDQNHIPAYETLNFDLTEIFSLRLKILEGLVFYRLKKYPYPNAVTDLNQAPLVQKLAFSQDLLHFFQKYLLPYPAQLELVDLEENELVLGGDDALSLEKNGPHPVSLNLLETFFQRLSPLNSLKVVAE